MALSRREFAGWFGLAASTLLVRPWPAHATGKAIEDTFLNDAFLLETSFGKTLYHDHASKLPVIDYHSHLPPDEIASNKKFGNITQIWLAGDHYKMRLMRANGVEERFITGDAPDYDKFLKWAETLQYAPMSPLYYWSHLELKRYFSIQKILSPSTAKEIYAAANEQLNTDGFRVQQLLKKMNVEVVCTTDDPADNLKFHKELSGKGVFPAWRPDKVMNVGKPQEYNQYLDKLSGTSGISIKGFDDLTAALRKQQKLFLSLGCKLSDNGIENFFAEEVSKSETDSLFRRVRSGETLNAPEISKLKSSILFELASLNHEANWVQQFHFGALRNNNSTMFERIGPDKGFDSIGDISIARPLAAFLDRLTRSNKLAKSVFYNLNPSDNDIVATMIANFNTGNLQFGAAWWFSDQKTGIEKQLDTLANQGLLGRFIGMTTDSRSFLSYPRHEFFRRVLCNKIGQDVSKGLLPNDVKWLGEVVTGICYGNAKGFFGF
ncbi:MAG TPA: glucuronate isomerase [Cyclobacteriaceae bacterium]|nr:glucuronate isomerase [Cyclobacteriaceae bacterium]